VPLVDGTIRLGRPNRECGRRRRSLLSFSDVVVANSRAGLEAWRVPPEKGRIVYNAFDPARLEMNQGLSRATAGRRSSEQRPFTVVMTARMHDHKDFDTLLAAARLVVSRSTPSAWRFLLVGDGPTRQKVEAAAAELVSMGVARFASPGLEVLPLVAEADVGVLMTNDATHAEGCSNSILEYMASGIAVVCCDSGGNKELVTDGVSGYVVPPGDAAALAHRLELLRAEPGRREKMGAAGRARLVRDFSLERMVGAYVGIYDDCVRPDRDSAEKAP